MPFVILIVIYIDKVTPPISSFYLIKGLNTIHGHTLLPFVTNQNSPQANRAFDVLRSAFGVRYSQNIPSEDKVAKHSSETVNDQWWIQTLT